MIGTTHQVSTAPPVSDQSTAFIMASMETIEMSDMPIAVRNAVPTSICRTRMTVSKAIEVRIAADAGARRRDFGRRVAAQCRRLAEDFSVVAPDTLGQGFTGVGDFTGGAPQPHFVAHLKALADQVGFDKFAMCGSSFGAMLCILTYFDIPERVEKLILISSGSATS